jgi:hypothetical protein
MTKFKLVKKWKIYVDELHFVNICKFLEFLDFISKIG